MDLRVMHIVHLFEVLEGLLFEDLIAETNPRYHLELNKEQKIEAKKFYSQEQKYIGQLMTVLARLCIRNLRHNPKLAVNGDLHSLLFDGQDTFIDLWGVGQE